MNSPTLYTVPERQHYAFYFWPNAVKASRHWVKVEGARCRVYKRDDCESWEGKWVLEVRYP